MRRQEMRGEKIREEKKSSEEGYEEWILIYSRRDETRGDDTRGNQRRLDVWIGQDRRLRTGNKKYLNR